MIWSANRICTFTVSFSFYTSSLLICSIFVSKWYNFPKIFQWKWKKLSVMSNNGCLQFRSVACVCQEKRISFSHSKRKMKNTRVNIYIFFSYFIVFLFWWFLLNNLLFNNDIESSNFWIGTQWNMPIYTTIYNSTLICTVHPL